jgi:hypothetical protein
MNRYNGFVFSLLAVAACSPFDPDLGAAPYLCSADNPLCPEGYTCQSTGQAAPKDMACLPEGGSLPDGGTSGFQCLEDTFGQNDTIQGAFQTPVAGQNQMFAALTSLCPEADKDNYAITVTSPTTIQVRTTWESGMPVNVSILNATGMPIGNGAPRQNATNENCVCLKDLPQATYYAGVSAGAQVKNNYRVEIKVVTTADCLAQPACNPAE